MAGAFKDHFSGVADAYAAARPEYPDALFDLLATLVPASARVWEPGCGSGQATRGLAARFAHVHATDPSVQQMAQHWAAPRTPGVPEDGSETLMPATAASRLAGHEMASSPAHASLVASGLESQAEADAARVTVAVEAGECTSLPNASVQLIAVAQALHWFDRESFFAECERVLAPGGVLAAWGYPDFLVPAGMEESVAAFRQRIDAFWPPERVLVDAHYADFAWPFHALPAPALWLEAHWTLPHFLRYLASMSAVARCRAGTGEDPVARHAQDLALGWGEAEAIRTIRWPLFLHLRRKA